MKSKTILKGHFQLSIILFLITVLSLLAYSCQDIAPDNRVMQAYELRINGNADSALSLLATVITEDSTNAQALFEIARTEHQIGLGDPSKLFNQINSMQVLIGKAVEYDPDNAIYIFYQGYLSYLNAYIAFMSQDPEAAAKVKDVVAVYESLLGQKPDYHEAVLYLVEILSVPEDLGGDSLKAWEYARKLKEADAVFGAKAEEMLLLDDENRIEFWQGVLDAYPGNPEVLEQLGKAYLYQDNVKVGVDHLEEAMKADPGKNVLLLDIARYYLMASRGDSIKTAKYMPDAEAAVNSYLETDAIVPLKAYAYSIMAFVKEGMGEPEQIELMREMAVEIDPNVSKAFGLPPMVLFSRPDELSHYYGYFSRPF